MKLSKITKITKSKKHMYDITIANNHNFFINNCLIHNCDYRDEIKIILYNLGDIDFKIFAGDRIAQGVISVVNQMKIEEIKEFSTEDLKNNRNGGFGSTGLK